MTEPRAGDDVKDWKVPMTGDRVMWPPAAEWRKCSPEQKAMWAAAFKADADEHAVSKFPSLRQQAAESLLIEAGKAQV